MIDLDKIEQQCKGAIENGYGHLPVLECGNAVKLMEVISRLRSAESEIDELLSMLRQAEKDAARYRWLRDESAFTHENAPLVFFTDTNGDQMAFDFDGSSYSVLHDEMLDAAIDEALQCK